MKLLRWAAGLLFALILVASALSDDPKTEKKEDGFVPMFDGKTLKGWVNVNCYPGTFFVKDEMIITTGKPTGFLRTEKQYENFIAEFDWMHIPPAPGEVGNSGFFVWADPLPAVGTSYTRGIEVQVLVNLTYKNKKGEITATSQGDLFSIWGAKCVPDRPHPNGSERCLPSEDRCKGANEWNHYRVEANDGVLKLAVNGKVVSGVSKCNPRKGYLALESEGSECRFRNLKIKELPSTDPKPAEIAKVAQDFTNLLTGTDLPGWKTEDEEAKKNWKVKDWMVHFGGTSKDKNQSLRTEKTYGDCEFITDFRFLKKEGGTCTFIWGDGKLTKSLLVIIGPDGAFGVVGTKAGHKGSTKHLKPVEEWNRLRVAIKDGKATLELNGENETPTGGLDVPTEKGSIMLSPLSEMEFGNLFVRPLKPRASVSGRLPLPDFGILSILIPEGLPLGACGQGPQFHQRPHMLHLPTRPRLLQPLIQQLLDRTFHQTAADTLTTTQPQRVVQTLLVTAEVIENSSQRRPIAPRRHTRSHHAYPLRHATVTVFQQTLPARRRLRRGLHTADAEDLLDAFGQMLHAMPDVQQFLRPREVVRSQVPYPLRTIPQDAELLRVAQLQPLRFRRATRAEGRDRLDGGHHRAHTRPRQIAPFPVRRQRCLAAFASGENGDFDVSPTFERVDFARVDVQFQVAQGLGEGRRRVACGTLNAGLSGHGMAELADRIIVQCPARDFEQSRLAQGTKDCCTPNRQAMRAA